MKRNLWLLAAGLALAASATSQVVAAPYVSPVLPPGAVPAIGPGVIPADKVFGKEYSHDFDHDFMGVLDPEKIVAWDGLGGTLNGVDFSLSRPATVPREQEVDAIANHGDALYTALYNPPTRTMPDLAHLVISVDDQIAAYIPGGPGPGPGALIFPPKGGIVPFTGPVALSNGDVIGGAADLSVEEAGVFAGVEVQHLWTTAPFINGMAVMQDVDGIELWGPEPATVADSDKYSLHVDPIAGAGTSVWNYDLGTGLSSPYISHAAIVTAVESLLGPVPPSAVSSHGAGNLEYRNAVNLDALMVREVVGDALKFESDPAGAGVDSIIFSIQQMPNPLDPDGYYATGSELFVLDGDGFAAFLTHGGHSWSHAYTLGAMRIVTPGVQQLAYVDIDVLEAIGELVVPEPATLSLCGLAAIGMLVVRRRAA